MVKEKIENMKNAEPKETESLLELYLKNPALNHKDIVVMACDFFLAGIDTVSPQTSPKPKRDISIDTLIRFSPDSLHLVIRVLSPGKESRGAGETTP